MASSPRANASTRYPTSWATRLPVSHRRRTPRSRQRLHRRRVTFAPVHAAAVEFIVGHLVGGDGLVHFGLVFLRVRHCPAGGAVRLDLLQLVAGREDGQAIAAQVAEVLV